MAASPAVQVSTAAAEIADASPEPVVRDVQPPWPWRRDVRDSDGVFRAGGHSIRVRLPIMGSRTRAWDSWNYPWHRVKISRKRWHVRSEAGGCYLFVGASRGGWGPSNMARAHARHCTRCTVGPHTTRARARARAARARARAAPAPAPGARTRGARAHARAPPPRAARARTRARVRTARFGTHAPGPVFPVLPLTVSSSRRRRMTVGHRLASLPRRARLMHIRGRRARSGSGARGVRLYGNGRAGPAPRRAPRVTPGSRRVFAAPGAPGTRHAAAQAPSQTDVV